MKAICEPHVKNPLVKNLSARSVWWVTHVPPGKTEGDFPYEKRYIAEETFPNAEK